MELKIEYVNKEELKPYVNNAKLHPAEQVAQIKNSIREFGFNDPIATDENDVLIEGHGRLIAAKELGFEEVPVIVLDNLTKQQKTAYSLVHNQLTLNTNFDYDLLKEELEQIETFDMTQYSFELFSGEYFDEDLLNNYESKVVIRTEDPNDADIIRDFLTENGFKFKEK